ncbi:MAG: hypothetical protein KKI02_00060, partial [Planctomycetes bacterium]|nr:hypothetical protein [Planctomycetota bacterium]
MTKPSPIALVVCDNVYREASGKTALVGLFDRIIAPKFPITHPQLCIYAAVTDIQPGTRFRIRIVHGETDDVVAELQGPPPEQAGPTTVCDFTFMLRGLKFKDPGQYFIQFWGNEYLLLQRSFNVEQAKQPRGNK